ncbi:MAG: protein-L-isoaspartate O-methyltransferase [Methanophagales archaeon]|nr:protein-L-isoaspartate O-methyltransferase [Methanophagales archaeon]RLG33520.1 MAG: protein-L-isoaspartate O-methyltransferase [Methanosarcinales archaeon]
MKAEKENRERKEEERGYEEERRRMVEGLRADGIGEEVLEAMMHVKRHLFVPPHLIEQAYGDYPLPIGEGQTISAPHMVAMMCDYLELEKGEKVLEVGAGSGYHAAVIAEIIGKTGHVYSVERIQWLVEFSRKNLKQAGYKHVTVMQGDGTLGLSEYAPYDKISVTCAAPDVPPPLLEQLKTGGKMVIPIGRYMQELYLVKKRNGVEREKKCNVVFVPLIGRYGFREH